ncbi:hypothetical protein L7F22_040761 [Adiantum nelumboides]|nr:hypothetical protein [Adiantum nelumboides]
MVNKAAKIGVKWAQPVLQFEQDSLGNTDSHTVSSRGLMLPNVVGFDVDKSVVLKKIWSGIAVGGIVQGICHKGSHQLTTRNGFNGDSLEVRGPINTCVRVPKQLELSEEEMTQKHSMKVAIAELLRPCRESIQRVEESEGVESGGDDAVEEMEVDEKFDVHDQETEGECIMPDKDVSPKLVAEVFKVAHNPLHKVKKVTDGVMRAEFGQPEGSRAYYMVWNCGKLRSAHLFWYLDRVCLLAKTAYMSKEAFAPIYYAECGQKVHCAPFIFDRLQLSKPRDKRRSPSVTKVAPYLHAIFSHVLQVSLTSTPSSFVKSPDVQNLSDVKRRKLDWDMLSGDKLKSALGQGSKSVVGTNGQGQSSGKTLVFPSMTDLPKIDTKSRTITLFPRKASEGAGEQTLLTQAIKTSPSVKSASAKEAMILTLETQKAEGERIDSLEREVAQLQSRVDEVLKEKKLLQEELARVGVDVRNQIAEMADIAQEF